MHNQIVEDVLTNADVNLNKPNAKEILSAVKMSYEKIAKTSIKTDEYPGDSLTLAFVNLILNKPDVNEMIMFLRQNGLYNDVLKEKMTALTTQLVELSNSEDSLKFDLACDIIHQFELNIVNDTSISVTDKNALLQLIAIGRGSNEFWYQNKDLYFSGKRHDWWGYIITVAADCAACPCPAFAAMASTAFWIATRIDSHN